MEIGEISDPIFRQDTVFFFKNKSKEQKNLIKCISKIKKQILNAKRNELFDLYSNSFMQIKNNSLIQYK